MFNLRWSLALGTSLSLFWVGCSDDTSTGGGTGGRAASTGGAPSGTGGRGTGGTTAMGSAPDATANSIKAFIAAGTYKAGPWKSDVAVARAAGQSSPHGKVRVWFNDTIRSSAKAGNGVLGGTAHATGSAAIKEFYDVAGANVVGHAAMVKTAGAFQEWAYYCVGAKALCGGTPNDNTEAAPFFKAGPTTMPCGGGCHFGNVFTPVPAP